MSHKAVTVFTPIVYVASSPNIVLTPTSSLARIMRKFIDFERQSPGRLNAASSGAIVHPSTGYFKAASDTFMRHIPCRRAALAMPDLISRKVEVLFDSLVTGMSKVSQVWPGYESTTWFGLLYGPKGLPADIISRLNQVANTAPGNADVKERVAGLGVELSGGTPQAFTALVSLDAVKWMKSTRIARSPTADACSLTG